MERAVGRHAVRSVATGSTRDRDHRARGVDASPPPRECATVIYVLEGRAEFSWGRTGVENALEASVGDFVHIRAGEVHVERNPSTTDDLVVLVCRNCPDAVTIYVD